MKKKKNSMIFHYAWKQVFVNLSPAQAKKLLLDTIEYAQNGTIPKSQKPEVQNAFSLMRYTIDQDTMKYDEKTNRLSENIKKSQKKRKKIESDNDNVNDNDNENLNDNANANDNANENDVYNILTASSPDKFMTKEFIEDYMSHTIQIEQLCYQLRTNRSELQKQAENVINDWQLTNTRHSDYKDAATHLTSVLRKLFATTGEKDWRSNLESEALNEIKNNGY